MRTLFVMDPLDRIQVRGDSTFMLLFELQRRGLPGWTCTPGDLFVQHGQAHARATRVVVSREAPHFQTDPPEELPLGAFDVVWMRKDPPFDIDYVYATWVLDLVPPRTLVLNNPAGLRNANEKLYAMQWPALCPETLATRDIHRAVRFVEAAPGQAVLKPWDGNGGRGVVVTRSGDPNLRSFLEVLSHEGRRDVLIQHYVPEIKLGDKRIILIEGQAAGWMSRVPQPGDHRGNMHVGARVEAFTLSDRDREICETIGPRLRKDGFLFVGIDVIGDFLTEINVTSPTGIQEINQLMATRLERDITDAVEARLERHRQDSK